MGHSKIKDRLQQARNFLTGRNSTNSNKRDEAEFVSPHQPVVDQAFADQAKFERLCASTRGQDKIAAILKSEYATELAVIGASLSYGRVRRDFDDGIENGKYQSERDFRMLLGKDPEARRWGSTLSRIGDELGTDNTRNWFIHDTITGGDAKIIDSLLQKVRENQKALQNSDMRQEPGQPWNIRIHYQVPLTPENRRHEHAGAVREIIYKNLDQHFPNGAQEVAHAQECYLTKLKYPQHFKSEHAEYADRFEICDKAINAEIWEQFKGNEAEMPTVWLADVDFSAYDACYAPEDRGYEETGSGNDQQPSRAEDPIPGPATELEEARVRHAAGENQRHESFKANARFRGKMLETDHQDMRYLAVTFFNDRQELLQAAELFKAAHFGVVDPSDGTVLKYERFLTDLKHRAGEPKADNWSIHLFYASDDQNKIERFQDAFTSNGRSESALLQKEDQKDGRIGPEDPMRYFGKEHEADRAKFRKPEPAKEIALDASQSNIPRPSSRAHDLRDQGESIKSQLEDAKAYHDWAKSQDPEPYDRRKLSFPLFFAFQGPLVMQPPPWSAEL